MNQSFKNQLLKNLKNQSFKNQLLKNQKKRRKMKMTATTILITAMPMMKNITMMNMIMMMIWKMMKMVKKLRSQLINSQEIKEKEKEVKVILMTKTKTIMTVREYV